MRPAVLAAAALAAFAAVPALAQPQFTLFPGQDGAPLLQAIDHDYSPAQTLGYNPARDSLYAYEQRTDGALCGVYTRFCIQLTPGADPSTDAYQKGINAEHTWPQSMGAADEPSRSDLHHLFPAKDNVNSSRGNNPYGEIPDGEADGWYREGQSQSTVPTVFVDEWSEKDNDHPDPAWTGRFEPREGHGGNAARAVFYYVAVYPEQVAAYGSQAFFDVQAPDLLAWHYQDPVDLEEYARSEWIATLQGTPNPFVLDSTLARRAFGVSGGGSDPGDPGPTDPPGEAGPLWVNEIHYDNDGTDVGEGVEVAGPAGTALAGWTLALYNGNGGTVYETLALSGIVPDQEGGYGTVWIPIAGLQNGAPDGFALVASDGTVAHFLSYEGVLTATEGPAAGLTSTDLGVAETSAALASSSLQLTDGGGGGGTTAASFSWSGPSAASPGEPNADQTLGDAQAPPLTAAWINELHYDNSGSDQDEGVEVAGTAGLDLSGWTVALYNGSTGSVYDTVALVGMIDDEGDGFGALWFGRDGLQNGAPDGLALVDAEGRLVQFLSYEGAFTATDGPASGVTSNDLGVAETSGTPVGYTLQLAGTGSVASDFAWAPPAPHTGGSINGDQVVTPPGPRRATGRDDDVPAAVDERIAVTVYPNPVRDRATVAIDLAEAADVRAEVFDALGRLVATASAGRFGAGFRSVLLDLSGAPAGLYVVRVTAGGAVVSHTVTVAR